MLQRKFEVMSRGFSLIIVAVACIVLLGWLFQFEAFKSVLPGLATMKTNTALGILFGGISLLAYHNEREQDGYRRVGQGAALIALAIGLLTLCEYAFGWNLGIDEVLFKDPATATANFPGRPSPITALNLVLSGGALFLLPLSKLRRPRQLMAIVMVAISFLAIVGYVYGVDSLYSVFIYSSMAIHTAILFVLTGLAILFIRPEEGFISLFTTEHLPGIMTRRLLPACIFVPTILGWLILQGQRSGQYDLTISLALFSVLTVAIMTTITWWNARYLFQIDVQREYVQEALEQSNSQFKVLFDEALDVIVVVDWHESSILQVNGVVKRDLAYRPEDLIGKPFSVLFPPSIQDETAQFLERLKTFGQVFASQEFLRADGTRFVRWI